eukprot:jgi/Botrbrau1/23534/Bobra.0141s0005.1
MKHSGDISLCQFVFEIVQVVPRGTIFHSYDGTGARWACTRCKGGKGWALGRPPLYTVPVMVFRARHPRGKRNTHWGYIHQPSVPWASQAAFVLSPMSFHTKELEMKFLQFQGQYNIRTAVLQAITLGIMLPAMLIIRCAIEGDLSPGTLRWLLLTMSLSVSFIWASSSPHMGHIIPCLVFIIRCHLTLTAIMVGPLHAYKPSAICIALQPRSTLRRPACMLGQGCPHRML